MQIQNKSIITRLQDYIEYKTVLNDCQVYYYVQIRYYIKYYMKNTIKSMIHCYMDMYVFCTKTLKDLKSHLNFNDFQMISNYKSTFKWTHYDMGFQVIYI